MDSFKNFQNIKAEKAKAMGKYGRMEKVTVFFKLIEFFIFMIVLSRFTTLFPISFKFSGEHTKEFFVSLISPRFVFILGNLIVFTLFWKSGQLSNQDCSNNNNEKHDFYDEYVKNCERNKKDEIFIEKQSIKTQNKENIDSDWESGELANQVFSTKKLDFYDEYVESCERNEKDQIFTEKQRKENMASDVVVCRDVVIAESYCMNEKTMKRSKSEILRNTHETKNKNEKKVHGLRRSATEKCLQKRNNEMVAVDKMSNEDFRLRVEAFIARQQRCLREEDEEE